MEGNLCVFVYTLSVLFFSLTHADIQCDGKLFFFCSLGIVKISVIAYGEPRRILWELLFSAILFCVVLLRQDISEAIWKIVVHI